MTTEPHSTVIQRLVSVTPTSKMKQWMWKWAQLVREETPAKKGKEEEEDEADYSKAGPSQELEEEDIRKVAVTTQSLSLAEMWDMWMSRLCHPILFTDCHLHGISPWAGPRPSHLIPLPRNTQWAATAHCFGNSLVHIPPGSLSVVGIEKSPFPLLPPIWLSHLEKISADELQASEKFCFSVKLQRNILISQRVHPAKIYVACVCLKLRSKQS